MKLWTAFGAGLALAVSAPAHATSDPTACAPYKSFGSGPDLVLTPGLGSAPEVWADLSGRLSEDYTVHLVHIAGFAGRAPNGDPETVIDRAAQEIVEYLDCQNIESALYAGHSLGGFLGLKLATEHPTLIERLVVVDSLPFMPLIFSPQATAEAVAPRAEALRAQIVGQNDEQFAQFQRGGVRSLVNNSDHHETVVDWTLNSDRATFAAAMHALMTTDLRPALSKATTPVTVIAASNAFAPRDRIEATYSAAYTNLTAMELRIVENSFHFIMFDQPAAFEAELRRALSNENP